MAVLALGLGASMAGCENPVIVKGVENEADPPHQECIAGASDDLGFRSCLAFRPVDVVSVLFVVDHGPRALGLQTRLADAMPTFVDALSEIDPALQLRVGFTTSQDGNPACTRGPGTAGHLWRASCREHPDDFVTPEGDRFDDACAARCSLDRLDDAFGSSDDPWLHIGPREDGTFDREAAAEALACNALLGTSACPFSAPLASTEMAWTRDSQESEAQNRLFRDDPTVVVIVSGGSECSVTSAGVAAFDPASDRALWSEPSAEAATAATCFAAGNICTAPDALGSMTCEPANIGLDGTPNDDAPVLDPLEHSHGRLTALGESIGYLFYDLPLSVFVIAGLDEADPTTRPRFRAAADPAVARELGVQPTCDVEGDPVVPASRLHALADIDDAWAPYALELASACAESWDPVLERIADEIAAQVRPICVPACVRDMDEDTPGLQVECTFTAEYPESESRLARYELPPCLDGETIADAEDPCWFPKTGDARHPDCATQGYNLELGVRWRGPIPDGTAVSLRCTLSQDKTADCPDLH